MNKETANNLFWRETRFVESSAKYTVYQIINKREKMLFKISVTLIRKGKISLATSTNYRIQWVNTKNSIQLFNYFRLILYCKKINRKKKQVKLLPTCKFSYCFGFVFHTATCLKVNWDLLLLVIAWFWVQLTNSQTCAPY